MKLWYFWRTSFFWQNEITLWGKKRTALLQTYNWENSIFFNALVLERQWKFSWSIDPAQKWAALSQSGPFSFFLGHQLVVTLQQSITIQKMRSKIHTPKYEIGAGENNFHISAAASIVNQNHSWERFASSVLTPLFHIYIILVLEHGNNIFPKLYWTFVKFHQSWSFPAKFTTII